MANTATIKTWTKLPTSTGRGAERIVLPLPPEADAKFEMEIYARFMRHLRNVPNSRIEIKILSAIQFTADMLETSEALVAKTLVDLGLLAPRKAFPGSFLDFCDRCVLRRSWDSDGDVSGPPPAVLTLREHWDKSGEGRFSLFPVHYAVMNENVYC